MRRLLLLLPLLLLPAFASAAHTSALEEAAFRLEANAQQFYRQVLHLRGNWRLKRQARRFAGLSHRFAHRASDGRRSPRLRHALNRLDRSFYDLQTAVEYAPVPGKKKRLRKRMRKLAFALDRVENRVASRARLASRRAWAGYSRVDDDYVSRYRRDRRYRD